MKQLTKDFKGPGSITRPYYEHICTLFWIWNPGMRYKQENGKKSKIPGNGEYTYEIPKYTSTLK